MNFNYKKNKLEQLKGLCAVVECKNSINDAAIRNNISATTVSKQISSLEQDLGFLLFDRVKNKLVLNEKGKAYYKEAKLILEAFDKLYDGKILIKVSRFNIWKIRIRKIFVEYKRYFYQKIIKLINSLVSSNYLFLFIIFLFLSIDFFYITQLKRDFIEKNTQIMHKIAKNIDDRDKIMDKILISNLKSWLHLHRLKKYTDIKTLLEIKDQMMANNLSIWDGNTGKLILATNDATRKGSPYYLKYLNYSIFDKEQCPNFKNMKNSSEVITTFPFRLPKIRHFKPEKFAILYDKNTNQYLNAMIDDNDEIREIIKLFDHTIDDNISYLELSGPRGNIIFSTRDGYQIQKQPIETYNENNLIINHNNDNILIRMPFGGLKSNACYDINRGYGTKYNEYFYILSGEFSLKEINRKIRNANITLLGAMIMMLTIFFVLKKIGK